jgi:lipopolysaccharide transport system ATP-binding protein
MNERTAIRAEGLSKRYRLGSGTVFQYGRLTESLWRAIRRPFRSSGHRTHDGDEHVWALRDVSLEVPEGEVLGIIGRNGAGKTTLLKILSRITPPTAGYAEVRGRVGSLLEVGTGFHPELTGRENILLNGAILGMRRREISRKFDEIVSFAGISRFIDTPVKRYSSGMYVRLAFAVAAHLDTEIMAVDEVLAVGDLSFQRKCLGTMKDAAHRGRTVLFVSHALGSISRLCDRVIWLDSGRIVSAGAPQDVVGRYLRASDRGTAGQREWPLSAAPGSDGFSLSRVAIVGKEGGAAATIDMTEPFSVEITYELAREIVELRVGFLLLASDGTVVFRSVDRDGLSDGPDWAERGPGRYVSTCEIPGNLLNEGRYSLTILADVPSVKSLLHLEDTISIEVVKTGGVSARDVARWPGVILPALDWRVSQLADPQSEP